MFFYISCLLESLRCWRKQAGHRWIQIQCYSVCSQQSSPQSRYCETQVWRHILHALLHSMPFLLSLNFLWRMFSAPSDTAIFFPIAVLSSTQLRLLHSKWKFGVPPPPPVALNSETVKHGSISCVSSSRNYYTPLHLKEKGIGGGWRGMRPHKSEMKAILCRFCWQGPPADENWYRL